MNTDVERALHFAAYAHRGQFRKGLELPYIVHPTRVVEDAIAAQLSVDAQVAAALHDVVEDTDVTHEELKRSFSQRSRYLVRLLTKWWAKGTRDDVVAIYKPAYYGAILTDPEATALKLLDRADNLRSARRIMHSHREWARTYHVDTIMEFGALTAKNPNTYVNDTYFAALRELGMALAEPPAKA